jgi:hypothetical protein
MAYTAGAADIYAEFSGEISFSLNLPQNQIPH